MGSRSWLFSDGEMCAAALLSPHCFPTPPHAANRQVYHLRLPHIGKRLSHIGKKVGRGCPSGYPGAFCQYLMGLTEGRRRNSHFFPTLSGAFTTPARRPQSWVTLGQRNDR